MQKALACPPPFIVTVLSNPLCISRILHQSNVHQTISPSLHQCKYTHQLPTKLSPIVNYHSQSSVIPPIPTNPSCPNTTHVEMYHYQCPDICTTHSNCTFHTCIIVNSTHPSQAHDMSMQHKLKILAKLSISHSYLCINAAVYQIIKWLWNNPMYNAQLSMCYLLSPLIPPSIRLYTRNTTS